MGENSARGRRRIVVFVAYENQGRAADAAETVQGVELCYRRLDRGIDRRIHHRQRLREPIEKIGPERGGASGERSRQRGERRPHSSGRGISSFLEVGLVLPWKPAREQSGNPLDEGFGPRRREPCRRTDEMDPAVDLKSPIGQDTHQSP